MKRFAKLIGSIKATLLQSGPKKPKKPSLMFGKYLLVTNTVSSGLLMLIGDWVAQEISLRTNDAKKEDGKSRYDYNRLLRMGLVGLLGGWLNHFSISCSPIYFISTVRARKPLHIQMAREIDAWKINECNFSKNRNGPIYFVANFHRILLLYRWTLGAETLRSLYCRTEIKVYHRLFG